MMDEIFQFEGICYGYTNKQVSPQSTASSMCASYNASMVYFYSIAEFNAVRKWVYDDLNLISISSGSIWTAGIRYSRSDAWTWELTNKG